eukprot:m.259039 g.259039  ORF g.259039 m.259039 type:complete len:235 (-) comp37458_c0_seq1:436-1140(-)
MAGVLRTVRQSFLNSVRLTQHPSSIRVSKRQSLATHVRYQSTGSDNPDLTGFEGEDPNLGPLKEKDPYASILWNADTWRLGRDQPQRTKAFVTKRQEYKDKMSILRKRFKAEHEERVAQSIKYRADAARIREKDQTAVREEKAKQREIKQAWSKKVEALKKAERDAMQIQRLQRYTEYNNMKAADRKIRVHMQAMLSSTLLSTDDDTRATQIEEMLADEYDYNHALKSYGRGRF